MPRALAALLPAAAVALLVLAPPAAAQGDDGACPTSVDRAVMNGAEEPDWPPACEPAPRTGDEVCARGTTLPRRLALRPDAAVGGVRLGMTRQAVCRRWGAPRLETRWTGGSSGWHYGTDVPGPRAWTTYRRAIQKMAYIVSWCRYLAPPSTAPCRPDDRAAAVERGGALAQLLDDDPPASADWVKVDFDARGRVTLIGTWRRSDTGPGGVRTGATGAGTHEALGRRGRDGGCERAGAGPVPPAGSAVLDHDLSVDRTTVRNIVLSRLLPCRSFAP